MLVATTEIDWLGRWRELVLRRRDRAADSGGFSFEHRERAKQYEASSRRKAEQKSDIFLEFIRQDLKPGETVLDVGAGTGRWTIPLAGIARRVTAVEPAAAMRDILQEKAVSARLDNIEIVPATWEEASVKPHDIVVCAHAMYSSPDLAGFVRKVAANARRRCYLALRLLPVDGIMSELSRAIYGYSHDSPDFTIAYNTLYAMGIYANVLVEDSSYHWESPDIDGALSRAKGHLNLGSSGEYDELIREVLVRRLKPASGGYIWPDGMRGALVWWKPGS